MAPDFETSSSAFSWITLAPIIISALGVSVAAWAAYMATKGVLEASRSAQRQLRAYLNPAEAKIELFDDGGAVAHVPVINTGQTPAHNLRTRIAFNVGPYPLVEDVPGLSTSSDELPQYVLGSNQSINNNFTADKPVPDVARRAVEQGTSAVYVHGTITYEDVFAGKQETAFRFYYSGPWQGRQALKVAPKGNRAT